MTPLKKQLAAGIVGVACVVSLIFMQTRGVSQEPKSPPTAQSKEKENDAAAKLAAVPEDSRGCVECHQKTSPGIVEQWHDSSHERNGIGCVDCHAADAKDADAFEHYGKTIATVVSPRDCGNCHSEEADEFSISHHAKGGNILASLDNFLAETVEGSRAPFNPHSPTPSRNVGKVNGMVSSTVGCQQCHGSKVAIQSTDGKTLTVDDFKPDADGHPTNVDAVKKIKRDENGRPLLTSASWPNTGIGRLNLDGSLGSCSACHSRHDFSPRRARQPENCGKCHLGPDHPQKEIYEESKHGVAYRDLMLKMNLDAEKWVLGEDYSQAPTCATCHMSANSRNGRKVTHNAGERISWSNRPAVSILLDTDAHHEAVKETDPQRRKEATVETWQTKRERMQQVCSHCHSDSYVKAFYEQYDDFVVNYNEKFAKPGQKIMAALHDNKLLTKADFDEEIEWTWFYLWHHEGRRARHGASMMAPDYAHWHGMFEVAERFYKDLIPQARELADAAGKAGNAKAADAVRRVIDDILARPEHQWYELQKKAAEKPDVK
jgi:hydroxylamine dehydrogenase